MKRQNNFRLLTTKNGKVFNIFDFYYDGKRRRLYAESDTEIRETVKNFAKETT